MTESHERVDSALASTQSWSWAKVRPLFGNEGCSVVACPFHESGGCNAILCCALNLSDALLRAGYALPAATAVNYCAHSRVRNADGMARVCRAQNGGAIDVSGWANRPAWKGIVYFEGNLMLADAEPLLATGHIDLWNGTSAVHTQFPDANTVWFWRFGA